MGTFSGIRNFFTFPSFGRGSAGKRNMRNLISQFQFTRIKHDIKLWREAIGEAEQAFYPHRVKLQRIYMDTVLNPHVHACLTRRNDLVLLKDFGFYSGEVCNDKVTEEFKSKWFYEFLRYALEAKYYGYSLISLGDIVNDDFPELGVIPRENVSPDREVLTSLVYQISGEQFNDPSSEFYNWCVWIPTSSDRGTSKCGYGLLYKIANLEIFLRALMGANANYNEKYGQPLRWGKTVKTEGKEYEEFEAFLRDAGENAYVITDPNDEIEFVSPPGGQGQGFKTYDNFETRLEKKISKVILGHSDALDSTPGKMGAQDGETSQIAQALEDIETSDAREIEHIVNDCLIPKLLAIGYPLPPGLVFRFKNDKEKEEIREKKDKSLQATANAVKTLSEAGWEVSEEWLNEHTEIPITKKEMPAPLENPGLDPLTKTKLKNLYNV